MTYSVWDLIGMNFVRNFWTFLLSFADLNLYINRLRTYIYLYWLNYWLIDWLTDRSSVVAWLIDRKLFYVSLDNVSFIDTDTPQGCKMSAFAQCWRSFSREGSLTCHTFCNRGPFLRPKTAILSRQARDAAGLSLCLDSQNKFDSMTSDVLPRMRTSF